jgi:hypothetical protein
MITKIISLIIPAIIVLSFTGCSSSKSKISDNPQNNKTMFKLIINESKEMTDAKSVLSFFPQNDKVQRFREVVLGEQIISGDAIQKDTEYIINFFEDATYDAIIKRSTVNSDGSKTNTFKLKEMESVFLILSSNDGRSLGNMHIPNTNQYFTIISNPETKIHYVIEMSAEDRDIIESELPIRAPAYPGIIEYQQPDGRYISIYLKGDERIKWAETTDGYTILTTNEGEYQYAKLNKDGDLVLSGITVSPENSRTEEEISFLEKTPKKLYYSDKQVEELLKKFN